MKKVIINYLICKESGMLGLKLEGVNHRWVYAVTSGMSIAHDIIEHNGLDTIGGIGNELEAMGALWWVRGAFNDINRRMSSIYSPYEILSNEISNIGITFLQDGRRLDLPIPKTQICEYDEDFLVIINKSRELLNDELDSDMDLSKKSLYFDSCIHYLRSGYRKAKRRYRRLNQCRVNSLFWEIAEAVDEVFTYLEYPGQRIELMYCLTSGKAKARILELEY